MTYLEQRLVALRHERLLVGWDFAFGYPEGFAEALELKDKPTWRAVWDHLATLIHDHPDNSNNRFQVGAQLNKRIGAPAGPFWGVPVGQGSRHLGPKRNFDYPVLAQEVLLPERRLVDTLHPRMQPAWKLAYTGSVGSQSLLGIPILRRLRDHPELTQVSGIWPFETGGGGAGAKKIVHAEIYPSMLSRPGLDAIPDREQVNTYVAWLQARQRMGELQGLLERPWGNDAAVHRQVTEHEGWILGVNRWTL
ncbi:hypothetical protein [Neolewinella sp.]|uniref:hypothetical protein n=1 Tax=Neolewinella sp. TaxID=2993543 RepID=UPI003B515E6B